MPHSPDRRTRTSLAAGAGAALVCAVMSMVGCRCVSNRHQAAAAISNDSGSPIAAATPAADKSTAAASTTPPSTAVVQEIFSGGLKNDWQDYGWTDREINGPGPARLRFHDWGGWIISNKNIPGTFGG